MSDTCLHCDEIIHKDGEHGWVHSHGGSQFAQRCAKCSKLTAVRGTPKRCPHCRQPSLFHLDHVAEPKPARRPIRTANGLGVGRGEEGHAAATVSALGGKTIQPDDQALRHLAMRPRKAPRWLG